MPQMLGRCPVCGEWGTIIEEVVAPSSKLRVESVELRDSKPTRLQEVVATEDMRLDMHCGELNRVLGGGLVPGSLVLLDRKSVV